MVHIFALALIQRARTLEEQQFWLLAAEEWQRLADYEPNAIVQAGERRLEAGPAAASTTRSTG